METTSKLGVVTYSKVKLCDGLATLVSPELQLIVAADPIRQAAMFKTAIWSCLTKLGSNKHAPKEWKDGLVFNNCIDTDGFSVSLHFVSPSLQGLTDFNGGFAKRKQSQREQSLASKAMGGIYITDLDPQQRSEMMARGHHASVDPGKSDVASISGIGADGKEVKLRYTAAQRRFESGEARHSKERRRMMDVELPSQEGGDRTTARLLTERIVRGKRSSGMDAFCAYLRSRAKCAPYLSSFYQRTIFRRQRYDAWLGRKASFDRLVDRIKTTFGKGVTLLYGDWGRSPNMKHQPPSPGIGFRRALAAWRPCGCQAPGWSSASAARALSVRLPCCSKHPGPIPRLLLHARGCIECPHAGLDWVPERAIE
jgi:hypothetical protein